MISGWVILLLSFTACNPVRLVSVERLGNTDLPHLKTFAFAKLANRVEVNRPEGETIKTFLREQIIREMETEGYQYAEENPDLLIDLDLNIRQTEQTRQTNFNEAPRYFGQRRYSWQSEEVPVSSTTTATISITVAEAAYQKKIWRGTARTNLSRKKSSLRLAETITLLLDRFQEQPAGR
jgi:hypothetical protein